MKKKAIIFDLDNTVYSVHSIGEELFASLFQLIIQSGNHTENLDKIEDDIMRRPFQVVANDYHFGEDLTQKGIALLKGLTYEGNIEPFDDYRFVKELAVDKFLVTTGFLKLQQSKVKRLKIEQDFKEIIIVDPSISDRTKKDVFADIIKRNGYDISEVLVVGDDPHSEIQAATDLSIESVLYDRNNLHSNTTATKKIQSFIELVNLI